MHTTTKTSVLLGAALLSVSAASQANELTANVGVTSNYVFRGITQTDDNPAVQGGIDFNHNSGLYAGAWASNVESSTGDKGWETDLYVGYNFKLNESVVFDVGYIAYVYSSTNINDADEIFFGASFKDFTATYYVGNRDVGPDYSYIDLKYNYPLPQEFNLHLHYGNLNDDAPGQDAEDASIGISKNIMKFDLGLTLTTVDVDSGYNENEIFITANKAFKLQ